MERVILPDVLTLEEASEYLRLPIEVVVSQAEQGNIPSRKIDKDWRFSKEAIDNWLRSQSSHIIMLQQAGAFADDDSLTDLRSAIYEARGRSEVDDNCDR
jgi:excisionase family DNA binding protein